MDYEKKYKEALELARVAAFNGHQSLMEGIFPELAESKDEKTRKRIIALVNAHGQGIYKGDMLAWLEKQGEQKQYDIDVLKKHITKDSISELAHTVIVRNGWEIVDAKEQNPAWSEEDDKMYNSLTEFEKAVKQVMEEAIECGDTHNLKADADMLLRLTQKPWSEEDETRLQACLDTLQVNSLMGKVDTVMTNWLKSLKPQNRDIYNPYKEVVSSIAEMCDKYKSFSDDRANDFVNNVKVKCKDAKEYDSIYPQNIWKPSEDQMDALYTYIYNPQYFNSPDPRMELVISVYEDLKKLMEE